MTTLRNNFNGGPDATVLTVGNSGQDGDDPFQSVSPESAGATFRFKDASALERSTAEFVLNCSNGATAASEGVIWSTSMGSQTQIWLRFYLQLAALPSGALHPTVFECDNGAAFTGAIEIERLTGCMRLMNGPATNIITSTNALVANQWARIEARFQFSTTTGNADLRLYLEPDSDTETETISFSGVNAGAANANSFGLGYVFSRANQPTMYLSGMELNNVGWPGPAPYKVKGVPGIQPSPVAIHNW